MLKKHPKRVYVFRRALVTVMAAFFAVVGHGLTSPSFTCQDRTITVHQGDSLWSIAAKHCEGDLLKVRYKLVKSYGTNIQPGQVIQLP